MVSTDCVARHCSAGHALAGIAIATMTSLCHRPMTGSYDRHALAKVCTVPVLLVEKRLQHDNFGSITGLRDMNFKIGDNTGYRLFKPVLTTFI